MQRYGWLLTACLHSAQEQRDHSMIDWGNQEGLHIPQSHSSRSAHLRQLSATACHQASTSTAIRWAKLLWSIS
jgi:hypothetical protein